eukprot:JP445450.1.p2 GENE.JP445450.1~~JP445450.1.p2  ORF type:complete len:52 (+),score=12.25 JP445450.1:1-156(+)
MGVSLFQMGNANSFFDRDPKGEDFEETSGMSTNHFQDFAGKGTGSEQWQTV